MAQENKGLRYNKGKLKWSYVHFKSLEPMVRVLMFGAEKYEPHNWMAGLDPVEILESMQRHLAALIDGQLYDPETMLPHMGGIQCNAMFYNFMMQEQYDKVEQAKKPNEPIIEVSIPEGLKKFVDELKQYYHD